MPDQQPVVVVLCGGTSRRLAGRDKTREHLAGTTVMDYLLDAIPPDWSVVCVGQERATTRSVAWCRESPVGGGPVAGIAAGLEHLQRSGTEICAICVTSVTSVICVVVGGDMPFAAAALPALVEELSGQPGLDAVLAVDSDGRAQPLLAAYRCVSLRAALPSEPGGARLMAVLEPLVTGTLACDSQITLDVDTPEALEQARHIVGA